MGKKNTTAANPNLQALKIGARIRHTEDSIEGKITWANATSVKIKWTDGELVTWKRADLASKPIEIIDAADTEGRPPAAPSNEDQSEPPAAPANEGQAEPSEPVVAPPTDQPAAQPVEPATAATPEATETAAVPEAPADAAPPPTSGEATEQPAKPTRQRKAPAEPKEKKLSCLDAAAKVLGEAGTPMTCQEMIETMAKKGYWSSPGGQTPSATLYSAILREVAKKGMEARFVKTERGKFGPKA